jgi:uncharacterized protein YwqG
MNSQEVESKRRYLLANGAGSELAEVWASYVRPYLGMSHGGPIEEGLIPLGATKVGGIPDGPEETSWPVRPAYGYRDRDYMGDASRVAGPLAFLAQINLADVVAAGGCGLGLPEAGLLQVYYDIETQPWGFDPLDRVGSRLVYVPPSERLVRLAPPECEWVLWGQGAPATFTRGLALPDLEWMHSRLKELGIWDQDVVSEEIDRIDEDVLFSLNPGGHVLGGWPNLIQGVIELECELVSNGFYCGDSTGYSSEDAEKLKSESHFWRQVVQLDSDDALDWMWGDGGRLYMMAREQEITSYVFERAHLILQCS